MKITWLGQAGLLFETKGVRIILNPYFSDSVEKINPQAYRRVPVDESLFEIEPDVMIFTHDHLDHYDPDTVERYIRRGAMTILAPASVWNRVRTYGGAHNYVQFDRHTEWTEQGIRFASVKAVHSDPCAIGVLIDDGERLYTLRSYKDLFEMRAADYIPPDVSHAGGIMELKKIAAAEAYYIPFAPHNPSGPVANAATPQLAACCPNFSILEIMYSDVDWRKDVTDEALTYSDGCITISDRPGLGIEINEEACLAHPHQPHTLRHYTGALTDIRPAKTEFYF